MEIHENGAIFSFSVALGGGYWHLRMDPESARSARESLELAFQMSNILETGLDRHTLSILIALSDRGLNPEALAALVRELRKESYSQSSSPHKP